MPFMEQRSNFPQNVDALISLTDVTSCFISHSEKLEFFSCLPLAYLGQDEGCSPTWVETSSSSPYLTAGNGCLQDTH